MHDSDEVIRRIVEDVVRKTVGACACPPAGTPPAAAAPPAPRGEDGLFRSMDDAVAHAKRAFAEYAKVPLSGRHAIVAAMRAACRERNAEWARMAVAETGLGRVEDKIAKNALVIEKTPGPECVRPEVDTGDHGLTLTERAPYGVIGSITPTTNPAATVINNTISFVSGGNTAVYNFHPSARGVCADVLRTLNRAARRAGSPVDLIAAVDEPTLESGQTMMKHPNVRVVVVTGGPDVVRAAFASGKKVVCAGPGNPPVVVDETADLERAARDIVLGCSFDNNVLCIAEKELIVVEPVADRLRDLMTRRGAFLLDEGQRRRLEALILTPEGKPAKAWVGKDAARMLQQLGIPADPSVRMLLAEVDFKHPFVQKELLMPVLGMVRAREVGEAIRLAVEAEHGYGHTAMMHSRNLDALHEMARAVNCSIFVKNGPSLSGLGYEGEGTTTMTIASPTGEGVTDARTFTRLRRCVLKDYFRIT